jgi:N-acetylglucosamine kinase-like BadF-type ATPase
MDFVLGVDGGNTKTIAVVARCDGTITGWGRGGCGDIYGAASPEVALEQVDIAVATAFTMAGVKSSDLASACLSLAGADWPEDFTFLRSEMARRGCGERVEIVNDAMGALRAGSPDGTGVVVVCGTGAAIGARSGTRRIWHSSFWQEPQGAVELGRKTLRAVYRAALGLEAPTTLTQRVLDFFQLTSAEQVLHLITSRVTRHPSEAEIGQLARLLLDEASRGDQAAIKLVAAHGAALGDYAVTAAQQVGIETEPFYLILSGGVLRHESHALADAMIAQVRRTSPTIQPVFSRFEPVIGALLLAMEDAGQPVDAGQISRIEETMPPAAIFLT